MLGWSHWSQSESAVKRDHPCCVLPGSPWYCRWCCTCLQPLTWDYGSILSSPAHLWGIAINFSWVLVQFAVKAIVKTTCSQSPIIGSSTYCLSSFVASIYKILHCLVKVRRQVDQACRHVFNTISIAKSRNMDLDISVVMEGVGTCIVKQPGNMMHIVEPTWTNYWHDCHICRCNFHSCIYEAACNQSTQYNYTDNSYGNSLFAQMTIRAGLNHRFLYLWWVEHNYRSWFVVHHFKSRSHYPGNLMGRYIIITNFTCMQAAILLCLANWDWIYLLRTMGDGVASHFSSSITTTTTHTIVSRFIILSNNNYYDCTTVNYETEDLHIIIHNYIYKR